MKTVWTIILGLALLWAQAPLPAKAADGQTVCCAKKGCCCVDQSDQRTPIQPLAPAPSASAQIQLEFVPQLLRLIEPLTTQRSSFSDHSSSLIKVSVALLFQRDCAYLI